MTWMDAVNEFSAIKTSIEVFKIQSYYTSQSDLSCTALQRMPPNIRTKFSLCLQLLGLTLLDDYTSESALGLLMQDETNLLGELFDLEYLSDTDEISVDEIYHCISLMRGLIEEVGGEEDDLQHQFDPQYSMLVNQQIYGAVVDIFGSSSIEGTNLDALQRALSLSSVLKHNSLEVSEFQELVGICKRALRGEKSSDQGRGWVYLETNMES